MSENMPAITQDQAGMVERVVLQGDLAQLSPTERVQYYRQVCESLGLNPLTQPFAYIRLNNKLTLYARKDAADQLRALHGVSITNVQQEVINDIYVVTVSASAGDGRTDTDVGAVNIKGLAGDALANAMMKAVTKAKRRVTLSLVGLGWLDETEIETIPDARPVAIDVETGEITDLDTTPPDWNAVKRGFTRDQLPVALRDAAIAFWQETGADMATVRQQYAELRKLYRSDPDACLDFWTNRLQQDYTAVPEVSLDGEDPEAA